MTDVSDISQFVCLSTGVCVCVCVRLRVTDMARSSSLAGYVGQSSRSQYFYSVLNHWQMGPIILRKGDCGDCSNLLV